MKGIPIKYREKFKSRVKPWRGAVHAILAFHHVVNESILVNNVNYYYGKKAYIKVYKYFLQEHKHLNKMSLCMVGPIIKSILNDHKSVSRGICKEENQKLV